MERSAAVAGCTGRGESPAAGYAGRDAGCADALDPGAARAGCQGAHDHTDYYWPGPRRQPRGAAEPGPRRDPAERDRSTGRARAAAAGNARTAGANAG